MEQRKFKNPEKLKIAEERISAAKKIEATLQYTGRHNFNLPSRAPLYHSNSTFEVPFNPSPDTPIRAS